MIHNRWLKERDTNIEYFHGGKCNEIIFIEVNGRRLEENDEIKIK